MLDHRPEPPAVVSPLAPTTPLARSAPIWESQRWLVGVALGCALGAVVFWLRNTSSDNRMLAAAQAKDSVGAYRAYLARGQRHKDLVSSVLLPRAVLREAIAVGTVAAIDGFIRDYPKTGIQAEVDAARKNAMAAELDRLLRPRRVRERKRELFVAEAQRDHPGRPLHHAGQAVERVDAEADLL